MYIYSYGNKNALCHSCASNGRCRGLHFRALPCGARADDTSAEIQALHQEIKALELKLDALEAKEAARDQAAAVFGWKPERHESLPASATVAAGPSPASSPSAAPAPKITLDDRGFRFASADGGTAIHLGGLIQFDSAPSSTTAAAC